MSRRSRPLFVAARLAAGAPAVHQSSRTLVFSADAPARLPDQGHGYLAVATPTIAALLAVAVDRWL